MGMAWRGITHCYRCGTTLADNEFYTCKNCERIEKEEEEKEMRDLGSLCDDYDERFNKEVENELNKKDTRKMAKAFKKAGISIDNKELEDLMRRIIQEELDKREKEDDNKKSRAILRCGHLALCYKTFIDRTGKDDEIEICMWNDDFTNSWTIASFEYEPEENCYKLESCGDRLNDNNIGWMDFGILVKKGYEILNDYID